MLCQSVVNFPVSWNRLLLSGRGVGVKIVIGAMPDENTSILFQLADELFSFHIAIALS